MKMMMQAPRDRAATPEAHEGGAPARPKKRAAVQWAPRSLLGFDSLAMSSPGDASEREADVAAQRLVQGLPARVGALPRVGVQRRCAACASAPAAPCATCGTREEEPPPIVQRRATGIRSAFLGIPIVPAGGGAPLPGEVRSTFGRLLGHDLSGVRVHTGAEAARSADGLSAEAYTVGDDVVFAAGRYAPQTPRGRELLAHELAHVAQQRSTPRRIARQRRGAAPDASPACTAVAPSSGLATGAMMYFARESADLTVAVPIPGDGRGRRISAMHGIEAFAPVNRGTRVRVFGYASADGETRYNGELSCRRASVVSQELRRRGVVVEQVLAAGEVPLAQLFMARSVVVQVQEAQDISRMDRGPEPPSIDAGLPPPAPAPMCGPNITQAFAAVLLRVATTFREEHRQNRSSPYLQNACGSERFTYSLLAPLLSNDWSWDIHQLYHTDSGSNYHGMFGEHPCVAGSDQRRVAQGGCYPTVEIQGHCYEAGTANYALYGLLGGLCVGGRDTLARITERRNVRDSNEPGTFLMQQIDHYKRENTRDRSGAALEGMIAGAQDWAMAGFAAGVQFMTTNGATLNLQAPAATALRHCELCREQNRADTRRLTPRWCGLFDGDRDYNETHPCSMPSLRPAEESGIRRGVGGAGSE